MSAATRTIIIGSRGSDLALWQANNVKAQLEALGHTVEIQISKTQGDKIQHLSFDKLEGKGFFTKEIEAALLNKSVDLAVHSHKDLETTPPEGLVVAAVSEREDPSELLLIRPEAVDSTQKWGLKANAMVGTSSARRKAILRSFRPDVGLKDLRGNVPTRVNKLREGQYDAILLANAGVSRLELGLSDLHVEKLDPREFVPAPAQGVLALQVREDDVEMCSILWNLNHHRVAECIEVERTVLNRFEGGCQLPLGVYCRHTEHGVEAWAAAANSWEEVPGRFHLHAPKAEGLADRIVAHLKMPARKSVFITRDLLPDSLFSRMLEARGMSVRGQSLIETRTLETPEAPAGDWYFFSSPTGVTHFLKQHTVPEGARVAAIGSGTGDRLRAKGLAPEFEGSGTDTQAVARDFAAVGSGTVVFPIGTASLRNVQRTLGDAMKLVDLEVYETASKSVSGLPESDVMVFTSPSNVEAYFAQHTLSERAAVVAMGPSTEAALKQHGVQNALVPWTASELALADAVL